MSCDLPSGFQKKVRQECVEPLERRAFLETTDGMPSAELRGWQWRSSHSSPGDRNLSDGSDSDMARAEGKEVLPLPSLGAKTQNITRKEDVIK